LSFLDHHIRVGNSLLGATPALIATGLPDDAFTAIEGDDKKACAVLKKRNKAERQGLGPLFAEQDAEIQTRLQQGAAALEELPDDRPEDIRAKKLAFRRHEQTEDYRHKKQLADAWCAAFVIRKHFREPGREASASGLTQGHLNDLAGGGSLPAELAAETERLARQYQFFHWHLAFPEVFAQGGFDCVLGNPPWERVKIQEKEWFAERSPAIANAPTAAARKRLIEALKAGDPMLHQQFLDDSRQAEGESHLMRNSGRYPLCAHGDLNTYAIFAELNRNLISLTGRSGCILPCGIVTDSTTQRFFREVVTTRTFVAVLGFINEQMLFPAVLHNFKFCLLILSGAQCPIESPDFVFNCYNTQELTDHERHFTLTDADIRLLNPNTLTCPAFFWNRSAEIAKAIYRRVPILQRDDCENEWDITLYTMFHMSNDSHLFSSSWSEDSLPVYEAKMMNQFNHRFSSYDSLEEGERSHMLPESQLQTLEDPTYTVSSCYYISRQEVLARVKSLTNRAWMIGFRGIAISSGSRTIACTFLPLVGASNSLPIVTFPDHLSYYESCFVACMSSFALDFVARQKLAGPNLNFFIIRQFAVLPPSVYDVQCEWSLVLQRGFTPFG
jgi:hypothetical protein